MIDWNRIGKFAGMLGSDHEGELVNAARFLASELKKQGATFGDLSERIGDGGQRGRERVEYVVRRIPENPAAGMAKATLDSGCKLDAMERGFLESIVTQAAMTSGNYDLTTRQAQWLMRLYDNRRMSAPAPKPKAKRRMAPDAATRAFTAEFV